VEQELLTLLEHWSSSPVFVQFRVVQFLVFFAMFIYLSFLLSHCIVFPLIYTFGSLNFTLAIYHIFLDSYLCQISIMNYSCDFAFKHV